MSDNTEILFDRRGAAGIVMLNRPQALNAITHGMVRDLSRQLEAWAQDATVTRVIVTAAGGRAFSAGGDIRVLTDLGRSGRHEQALQFWRDEYRLNFQIKRYPKPYVSLIDGIVMGGGVGISIHGSHRVAADRFQFAMPEVGIGFFPDVGATWFLPRMPGEMGTFCALTGERLRAADALASDVATHFVPGSTWTEMLQELTGSRSVDEVLATFGGTPEPPILAGKRKIIDRVFTGDRVEGILEQLDQEAARGGEDAEFCSATASTIRTKSPLSLKIALNQVRKGRNWSFEDCMRAEFRIVSRIIHGHDFYEGVRSAIVDKDQNPRWRPAILGEVSDCEIARHFEPLASELTLT